MALLIATNNPRKQEELKRLLQELPATLRTPKDVGLVLEVEESGEAFVENALLKARAFSKAVGMPALADDSGLCVDALGGRPGINSARFGGLVNDPIGRNHLLLSYMRDVPEAERGAEFVCVAAFSSPTGDEWTVEGRLRGAISTKPCGCNGFGYDPIFLVPDLGRTLTELSASEKDAISHRSKALRLARKHLENSLG